MDNILSYAKEHPWVLAAILIGGGFVFYELALKGSSGSTTLTGYDPGQLGITSGGSGNLPSTVDQGAMQANAANMAAQMQFSLAYLTQQQAGQDYLANLSATTSTVQQTNAIQGTLAQDSIQADLSKFGISTQAAITKAGLDTQVTLAGGQNATSEALSKIASDTTLGYAKIINDTAVQTADIQAKTTVSLAGLNAALGSQQIDAAKQIAISNNSTKSNNGLLNVLGNILPFILG